MRFLLGLQVALLGFLVACGGATGTGGGDAVDPNTHVALKSDPGIDGHVTSDRVADTTRTVVGGNRDNENPGIGYDAFFSFLCTSVPVGATIESATLRLWQDSVAGDLYGTHGALHATHTDYGSTLDGDDWDAPALGFDAVLSTSAEAGWKELDVREALLADLAAGRPRTQFRIRTEITPFDPQSDAQEAVFEDGENHQGTGFVPELVVVYADAPEVERCVRACRQPGLAFGGADGTPTTVTDEAAVAEDIAIGRVQVAVRISHAWVGDIELDLVSPAGTVVRPHDRAGHSSDDLIVRYSDNGVPNGSEPFGAGCYMQVPGTGGGDMLADFDGESSLGTWTLRASDAYPATTDGTIEYWCLFFFEDPPSPAPLPVENLDCGTTSDGAVVSWTTPHPYGGFDVLVDDELVATLPGSATSYTIDSKEEGTPVTVGIEGLVAGRAPSCTRSGTFIPLGVAPEPLTSNLVLVLIDGLRYSEGLGDPLRQHVPEMDALADQGTIIEPFLCDGTTKTAKAVPAVMNGSWAPSRSFFDPECQAGNQHSEVPYVHECFRRQLNRPAEDCVYVLGPYCPWRASFRVTYGPAWWPQWLQTEDSDDANWEGAKTVLATQRPSFLTLYLSDVDAAGHSWNWSYYISTVENADRIVGELWDWLQEDPHYAGRTTVLVTNDHGRHTTSWGGHGCGCDGCRTIQFLAIGPGIKAGHVSNVTRTIPDIAPTIGRLLGFKTEFADGEVMTEILDFGTSAKTYTR